MPPPPDLRQSLGPVGHGATRHPRWVLGPTAGTAVLRRYVLAGVAWALVAAVLALGILAPVALGWSVPWPALGPGRLDAAYRLAALWGYVWLPLMAGLLWIAGLGAAGRRAVRAAGLAFWLWQVALMAGVAAILAGWAAPAAWSAAPAGVQLLLWLAVAGAGWAVWAAIAETGMPLSTARVGALVAVVALLATQTVGLLAVAVTGAGQAVVLSMGMQLQGTLCVPLAGIAVACAVLPMATSRPLYSLRLVLVGWILWVPVAVLAAGQDLVPDLYPSLLAPLATASAAVWLVPVSLLTVAVLGTWVGHGQVVAAPAAALASLGLVAVLAAAVSRTGLVLADSGLSFTAYDPAHVLVPPLVAGGLLAAAAAYAVMESDAADWRPRWQVMLLVTAGLLAVLPLMVVSLVEAAVGPSAAVAAAEARLRLPGALVQLAAVGVWLAAVRHAPGRAGDTLPVPASGRLAVTPAAVVTAAAGGLVATLFLALFVPLADPGSVAASPLLAARDVSTAPLRAEGRRQYVADGCVACHTQRVRRLAADAALGPTLQRGDYGAGPALAGQRRMGPDLTWVGDRYPTPAALATAMAGHGSGGALAMPWLLAGDGPTAAGAPLIDYLLNLHSDQPTGPEAR